MKSLKWLLIPAGLYFSLIFSGTSFSSCTKTNTVHDTVTVIKKDTVTVVDSMSNLKKGLVAYYTFTNGSLKDSSGYGNDIITNSATKTGDRFGTANNAYLFDGASSFMQVKNSTSLNPQSAISLVAMVKLNGFNAGAYHGNEILGKGNADNINGFYTLRGQDGLSSGAPDPTKEFFSGYYGDNGNGSYANADTSIIKLGQWYTIIFTYDGYESRIYLNGALKNIMLKKTPFTPNSNDLFIGRHESATYPYFLNGVIDEVRIYNRALNDVDIRQLNNLKQ
ncbi:MAG: LamG domain-containing protein [Bacteroidetes bacterium]|nr:LamG domain-containing protein [Bacteroidota bacterium]